jgi:hypothetical protein
MNNTKQKNVYYEYEICVDGDVRWFYLGDEASLIEDAIEYKNSGAFLDETENYNVVEIQKWTLDRNPASGGYREEYHPEYFEIYPDFGSVDGRGYSTLKYENLPKYIQKKIDIIRKALA